MPTEVQEGAGATAVTVTATLNTEAFDVDSEVAVQVAGGTATAGDDFAAVPDFTLTIPAGQLSGTATFTLTPVDDGVIESATETVAVTGTTTVTGLTVTPSTGVTVLIRDDDVRGVAIVPTDLTIDEGQTGTYSVVLTAQPTGEVTVTLSLPADAAVSVRPTSVVFTATEWNKAEPVRITATADADAEHTIGHTVAGADYGSASAADVAVTVVDDETPSTAIKLRADRVSVAEGGGDRTVTVTAALDEAAPPSRLRSGPKRRRPARTLPWSTRSR